MTARPAAQPLTDAEAASDRTWTCHHCGHPYEWSGGISFEAVSELGRLIREHYEQAHPEIEVDYYEADR